MGIFTTNHLSTRNHYILCNICDQNYEQHQSLNFLAEVPAKATKQAGALNYDAGTCFIHFHLD